MTDDERLAVSKALAVSGLLAERVQEASVPLPRSRVGRCCVLHLSAGATSSEEEGAGSPEVLAPLPIGPLLKAPSPAGPFLSVLGKVRVFTAVFPPRMSVTAPQWEGCISFTGEHGSRYAQDPRSY